MHALVSLLPAPFSEQVEALWQELEDNHGLTGIRVTPFPHFSWHIAQDYDFPALEKWLSAIAANIPPFKVRTTGIGLFTGPRPVVYIPLVKDSGLMSLHAMLWEQTFALGTGMSPYYSPEAWIPHISLAYGDVDRSNIAAVLRDLVGRSYAWEMTIDNLALIYEPDGQTGQLKSVFHLTEDP